MSGGEMFLSAILVWFFLWLLSLSSRLKPIEKWYSQKEEWFIQRFNDWWKIKTSTEYYSAPLSPCITHDDWIKRCYGICG